MGGSPFPDRFALVNLCKWAILLTTWETRSSSNLRYARTSRPFVTTAKRTQRAGRVCTLRTNRESSSSRALLGTSNGTSSNFAGYLLTPIACCSSQLIKKSQSDDMASEIHRTLHQRQAMTGRPVMARLGVGIDVVSVGLQADQEESRQGTRRPLRRCHRA